MPIYDYRCDHCGHVFSAVRSFSEGPVEKCPSCGKKPRRLIVAPAIVFKGGGWYKTDSRGAAPSEDGAPAASSDKSDKSERSDKTTKTEAADKAAKKTEAKPDAKSETKPETKSEPKALTDSAKSESKS
ncbi:MAG TPA: FmdB family zinc ribbon protein [Candidatus Limnocylindrales bacterium]|nr:FmdB family zinc ribbon protein [Candidatus Limnocylindrales bacterium]